MRYDRVEWDDRNRPHALRRATEREIEQAIRNASRAVRSRRDPVRIEFVAPTDGGRLLKVIAEVVRDGVRPITAWEVER